MGLHRACQDTLLYKEITVMPYNKSESRKLEVGSPEWAVAVVLGEIELECEVAPFVANAREIGYTVATDLSEYVAWKKVPGLLVVRSDSFLSVAMLLRGDSQVYSRQAILEASHTVSSRLVRDVIKKCGVYHLNPYGELVSIMHSEALSPGNEVCQALEQFADWFNSPSYSFASEEDDRIECEKLLHPLKYIGWPVEKLPAFGVVGYSDVKSGNDKRVKELRQRAIIARELKDVLSDMGAEDEPVIHIENGKVGICKAVRDRVVALTDKDEKALFIGAAGKFSRNIYDKAWRSARDDHNDACRKK